MRTHKFTNSLQKLLIFMCMVTLFIVGNFISDAARADSSTMGPLAQFLQEGQDGLWNSGYDTQAFWLENNTEPAAVRYYYYSPQNHTTGFRTVSVDLKLEKSQRGSRIGLLYGYQQQSASYYMIVVEEGGTVSVYKRDQQGLRQMSSQSSAADPTAAFVNLKLTESSKGVQITAGGRTLGSFGGSTPLEGGFGIGAMGVGKFLYRSFQVSVVGGTVTNSSATPLERSAAVAQRNTTTSKSALELTAATVHDKSRSNMAAYHIMVPKGWKLKGEINSAGPMLKNIPYLSEVTVEAPDGRYVHFYPFLSFTWRGQPVQEPLLSPLDGYLHYPGGESLGPFWNDMMARNSEEGISNYKLKDEGLLPEATRTFRQMKQPHFQSIQQMNMKNGYQAFQYNADVRQLHFEFKKHGTPMEELVIGTRTMTLVHYPNGMFKAGMWTFANAYGIGGKTGTRLEQDPELAAIVRSFKINPEWGAAIDNWFAQRRGAIRAEVAAAGRATAANQTFTGTSKDVLDISFEGWKKRNAMNSAGQTSLVNSIHEQTTYTAPHGNPVNLPSFYQNVYTDGQGHYVLHNDANYQINTDPNFNSKQWTRMHAPG